MCAALGAAALVTGCATCEPTYSAPGADWPTGTPEAQGFDSAALASVIERIHAEALPVDSLLVVRNGVLVLDAYFYPYLGDRPHDVASVTKSITSTLIGIAIDRGLVELDENVLLFFDDLGPQAMPNDAKADMQLRHLLTMTSGLACGRSPGERELYEMIASDHYVRYALALPMVDEPGDSFAYCSPGSHLLSAMVAGASNMTTAEFAKSYLFDRIGVQEFVWPTDPQGIHRGWGDLQLHPRDMARIGLLFLNSGAWNEAQVVSKGWVEQATRPSIVVESNGTGYGYQWWVLSGPFEGLYEARGRGGQAIIVWPDKEVVVVFTGRGVDVRGEVGPRLAAALKSDRALDANPEAEARLRQAVERALEPPAPRAIPKPPPTAAEVSGTVYGLEANPFGLRCASLRFGSASDVTFFATVGERTFELPVGMDGVPRFSETGPTGMPIGLTGRWTGPRVFELSYDEVAGPNHLLIQVDFTSDGTRAVLRFIDPTGHFRAQSLVGSAASKCP